MELVSKESSYISSSSQKDYTRNTLSYSINPNSSKIYILTFAPASATTYAGNVVITSNDPNNPSLNIAVTGLGYIPNTTPAINLPESFSFIKNVTPIDPATYPIYLKWGWNLVPYYPEIILSVYSAMQSIASYLQEVKLLNQVYIPESTNNILNQMEPGKGYWVKVSQDCILMKKKT